MTFVCVDIGEKEVEFVENTGDTVWKAVRISILERKRSGYSARGKCITAF